MHPTLNQAGEVEVQIPIVLVQIDEEFWTAVLESKFNTSLPILSRYEGMLRVIAIPPMKSTSTFILNKKNVHRIQLPLIPAFCLTIHKAQGLTKELVLYFASDMQFARALSYVAISRCTCLNGLYIVGRPLEHLHFVQRGIDNDVIIAETDRLRKFQQNTLRKGYICSREYWEKQPVDQEFEISFSHDEPEF